MADETCVTDGGIAKRHFRHTTVVTITGAIVAILIYNLQDHITPIVESHDICNNDSIIGIFSWLFPRINAHCYEIFYTDTGSHESADVAIIIDLYVGGFFVYILSTNIIYLMRIKENRYLSDVKTRWYDVTSKSHFTLMVILPFSLIIFLLIFEGFYSGDLLIPEEDVYYLTRSLSILHSHIGFGAMTQVFQAVAASFLPEAVYMLYVLVREDMTND